LKEATIKASKKMNNNVGTLKEEKFDGYDNFNVIHTDNEPIENYSYNKDSDTLHKLYVKALQNAELARNNGEQIYVYDIKEIDWNPDIIKYFSIETYDENMSDIKDDNISYVIYQINADIYYRPGNEFFQIIQDFKDEVPGQTIEALKYEYTDVDEPLQSYSITNISDCMFIISSIFSSILGNSYDNVHDIYENIKIRKKTKLGTDDDIDDSKAAHDAKYRTKEQTDFE